MNFTIIASVEDLRVGEATFTAEELRSTLCDALSDLHLKVKDILVVHPKDMPTIPGGREVGRVVQGEQPLPVVGDEVVS